MHGIGMELAMKSLSDTGANHISPYTTRKATNSILMPRLSSSITLVDM